MEGEWVGGDGSAVRGVFVCVQEMVSSPLSRKSRWYPIKVLKSDGTEVIRRAHKMVHRIVWWHCRWVGFTFGLCEFRVDWSLNMVSELVL